MKINVTKLMIDANNAIKRFSVCLFLLLLLTLDLIIRIITDNVPDALSFFLSVGMLVALLLHISTEDSKEYTLTSITRNVKAALLWVVPFVLLGIDSYVLHIQDWITNAVIYAQSAFVLSLLVALCFVPFWKEKDDRKSWNFVFGLVKAGITSEFVGLVMWGGLTFLYYDSSVLFGFKLEVDICLILLVLFSITLSCILFLILIPDGSEKQKIELPKSNFLLGTIKYLFIPLAILYIIVLYVYGIKIAVSMTLPKGMLSYLISVLMFGIIAIVIFLYPYASHSENKGYEIKVSRILPLLALPLLVLMSIGIGKRVSDYGITDQRLYLITLNVWFYAVAIGLWWGKGRRIHWVSISFAVLLVLTSCHPWNFNKIYGNILKERFETFTEKHPLPSNINKAGRLNAYLKTLPAEEANEFYNNICDIHSYDREWYRSLVGYTIVSWTSTSKKEILYPEYVFGKNTYPIPNGYSCFSNVYESMKAKIDDSVISNEFHIAGYNFNDSTFTCTIEPYGQFAIRYKDLNLDKTYVIKAEDGNSSLLLKEVHFEPYGDEGDINIYVEGIVFHNRKGK